VHAPADLFLKRPGKSHHGPEASMPIDRRFNVHGEINVAVGPVGA